MSASDVSPSRRDFRERVREFADELGVRLKDVLIQSPGRDPLNKGTTKDHKKARWFRGLWREATDNRGGSAIHVRGVHYATLEMERDVTPPGGGCSWDIYENTTTCFKYLSDAAVTARVLGYVPLDGILDEKNDRTVVTEYGEQIAEPELNSPDTPRLIREPDLPKVDDEAGTSFGDVDDAIERVADYVAGGQRRYNIDFDRASQQPYHIELWSEKTLPEAVHETAERSGVNVIVEGQGQLSYTIVHDLVQRIERAGKPAVVFFLADFDPAGTDMVSSMASKANWMDWAELTDERVIIDRLGLTAEQIIKYDIPVSDLPDTESAAYEQQGEEFLKKHEGAAELQALEADLDNFCEVVRDGVAAVTDDTIREQNERRLQEFERELKARIVDALQETDDLSDKAAAVENWVDEANSELEDARETLSSLRAVVQDDDRPDEFRDAVDRAIGHVMPPDIEPPEGEADPPEDPLYDAQRPYLQNLAAAEEGGE